MDEVDDLGGMISSTRAVLASRVVGRRAELTWLRDGLKAAAEGYGRVAFLVGEAAIGKSRLAQVAATDTAHRGWRVLRGRAVQAAPPAAYRPLAEALCSAVRSSGGVEAAELSPFMATLARLIPEWRVEGDGRVEDSVVALAEAVLRFLRATAGDRGCLLVLEDMHWADPETLAIVEYLAANLISERVLCLATVRSEDPSPGLQLARSLAARRVCETVGLGRLTDDEVAEMVRVCLGAATMPEEVLIFARRADGVPFLVEELLAGALLSGALVDDDGSWTLSTRVGPIVPLTFAEGVHRRPAIEPGSVHAAGHIQVVRSAAHAAVLEHAGAVITHAGHGTVIKALAADVPVVCIPMGRDQADNAARVVAHGGGVRLSPRSSPRKIATAVTRVLGDPEYRVRARALGDAIRADVAAGRAIPELEDLLVHGPSVSHTTSTLREVAPRRTNG